MAPRSRSRLRKAWDEVVFQIDSRWPPDRRTFAMALAVIAAGVFVVFGFQVLSARSSLTTAAAQADLLQNQISVGDVDGARSTLAELQDKAGDARSTTDGVLWKAGAKIPWLGRNISTITVVSAEMDRVATQAAPPIVELADQLSAKAFNPRKRRVDIGSIAKSAPNIAQAAAALEKAKERLADIKPEDLLTPLRSPVAIAQSKINTASTVASNADVAAQLLPNMLGGDGGTRRYLMMVQNSAESRPTGGITGSFAVIEAKDGRISMVQRGSAPDLPPVTTPVAKMTKDEKRVFPSSMVMDLRDANITPHFPRTATIAKKLYEQKYGKNIDGVVSIDPVALSYLLGGIGPVEVRENVVLDQSNVVALLLHQVYVVYHADRSLQDDFFEASIKKIFDQFAAGAGDPSATLRGLVQSVNENRITLWSARKGEQEVIAPTDLSGRWFDDEKDPRVAVLLSDGASTKMEYFLNSSTTASAQNCLDGDRQVISMTTDLTSTAPKSGLPQSITGPREFVRKGWMRLIVRMVSPTGGHFTSVKVNGKAVPVYANEWQDRNITWVEVNLRPGQTVQVVANATSGKGQTGDPTLTVTPGISSQGNDIRVQSSCS